MQKSSNTYIAPQDSRVENTLLFATTPFYHFFCAFMNLSSAVIQLSLFYTSDSIRDNAKFPIYIQTMNATNHMNNNEYMFQEIFTINILVVNSSFLFIAACYHTFYAYYKIKFNVFISPRLRFVEYAMVTPIIFLQLGVLAGVRDVLTLITLTALVANSMLFGYIQDRLSGTVVQWDLSPHEWGYMAYAVMWAVVLTQFFRAASDAEYVVETYVIVTIYVAYFSQTLFAVIQFYFVVIPFKRGYERIDDTSIMEMDGSVHLLSLVTKMAQAWIPVVGFFSNS